VSPSAWPDVVASPPSDRPSTEPPPPPGVLPPVMVGGVHDDAEKVKFASRTPPNDLLPGEIENEEGRGQSSHEDYKPVGGDSESGTLSKSSVDDDDNADDAAPVSAAMSRGIRTSQCGGPSARKSVFDDPDAIKAKVRQSIMESKPVSYAVEDLYWDDGLWRLIATHDVFLNGTLTIISANAIWMAIDTNYNSASSVMKAEPIFQLVEQFFCVYFSFEWFVRFMAFRRKLDGRKDAWFVFDSVLVLLMVMETWALAIAEACGSAATLPFPASVLRLFRLLRLSRLMRMLRSLPELMILVKGMVTALKSVGYVLGLLVILLYIFAIAFTQLTGSYSFHEAYFQNVGLSMYSLFIYGTFLDDLAKFCDDIRIEAPECFFLVLVYISMGALTVMNMLIGVLCEIVDEVARSEKEEMAQEKARDNLKDIVDELDTNGDGRISYKEFKGIFDHKHALQSLSDIDVDPISVVDFTDHFFIKDGKECDLPFEQFMELLLDLRSSNEATVKDMWYLWKQVQPKLEQHIADVSTLRQSLDAMLTNIATLKAKKKATDDKLGLLVGQLEKRRKQQVRPAAQTLG
jgi:voltage-gated sodium channel